VKVGASARLGDRYGVERAWMAGGGPSTGYIIRRFTTPEHFNLVAGGQVVGQNPVRE
jgi:hypothetical protein